MRFLLRISMHWQQLTSVDATRLIEFIRKTVPPPVAYAPSQRLILVITDGAPHDIDIFHPDLLAEDAARAIAQSGAEGTPVFGVSVDKDADVYLRRMFGPHQYLSVDNIEQLPERLPSLYLRLHA